MSTRDSDPTTGVAASATAGKPEPITSLDDLRGPGLDDEE